MLDWEERQAIIEKIASGISAAIQDTLKAHENPMEVYALISSTLAGLSGAQISTMRAAGLLGDGEDDKVLEGAVAILVNNARRISGEDIDQSMRAQRAGK